MSKNTTPHVAVLVDTATGWGRRVVRGIGRYVRKHGPWDIWIEARDQRAALRLPVRWCGQGIIARVPDHATARHVVAARVPVVNVSAVQLKGIHLPGIRTDLQASARMAAEYLLDRGFRNFAYCGIEWWSYTDYHRRGFAKVLGDAGYSCDVYRPSGRKGPRTAAHIQQRDLIGWLERLPKPLAVLTWTTKCGHQVIQACRHAELLVPEQVAVLAADEDDLLCDMCNPPLSGIALTSERIGYEAAALLDRLMHGEPAPAEPVLIEPSGVVTRQSTDTLAIDDADVASAVAYIWHHAADPIQVRDVLRAVPVSRTRLERRFQTVLGRTPAAEIRRVHLERAKHLLAETDMPVPEVAVASGFGSREYLSYVFKSQTGLSPQKYRIRVRIR